MRPGLILLLLIGLPGAAMAAEDRYGPTRTPDPALTPAQAVPGQGAVASGYGGQMLSWSGKPAAAPRIAPAQAPAAQVPVAQAPTAQAPAAQPPPQAYAGGSPQQPARLPTSLYDTPAPPVSSPPREASWGPPAAQQPAPQGPAPQAAWPNPAAAQPAAALPPPPSPPPLSGGTAWGEYQPRSYSVVREYGGTPDRIPAPPPQSAFRGSAEIALDPGLLSESRSNEPPAEEEDEDPPRRPEKPAPDKQGKVKK